MTKPSRPHLGLGFGIQEMTGHPPLPPPPPPPPGARNNSGLMSPPAPLTLPLPKRQPRAPNDWARGKAGHRGKPRPLSMTGANSNPHAYSQNARGAYRSAVVDPTGGASPFATPHAEQAPWSSSERPGQAFSANGDGGRGSAAGAGGNGGGGFDGFSSARSLTGQSPVRPSPRGLRGQSVPAVRAPKGNGKLWKF